ncbi:penicillin-binding protein activator LpoB [Massilia cavernae]|uniref:Penicillin-binding protein activator LpoB n=1 Tax=Massilia cavernae TaxID=2320864 RepID=A0A418XGQ2_9BURK|nr:penicillin-binding protein activator LpoB [Massilia cavernae]RJG11642.1 penicillin-binding protein activator LpoB [Massilia cavernae]
MNFKLIPAALLGAALLAGCATPNLDNSAGRRTTYQDVASPSATVAGVGVESQDVVSMTDKMVRDILSNAQVAGRATAPRVIIDSEYFSNDSSTRMNKNAITDRLRVELNRASNGRLVFVARHYGNMVDKEREAKRAGEADRGTIRTTKAQAGGDFRLGGRITSMDAASTGTGNVSRYHQITFELIDLEYGTIVWSGIYEFKKEARDDIIYR